jgi:hypothetical protein
MNISLNIDKLDLNNLFFLETKKNIVMNGNFTKIIYSDSNISLNGLYVAFEMHDKYIEPFYDEYKEKMHHKTMYKNTWILEREKHSDNLYFSKYNSCNLITIKNLCDLEHNILEYYQKFFNIRKNNEYLLKEQLNKCFLKIYKEKYENHFCFNNHKNLYVLKRQRTCKVNLIIKISGVWENTNFVGINYKIISCC